MEYSVVYTDRSLNHMSKTFQAVMNGISTNLKEVYSAEAVALIPGGGTYGMEAVARQFVQGSKCLVIRNGWFSYRWTQIIEACGLTDDVTVLKATRPSDETSGFSPVPIDDVVAQIHALSPLVVFAPHVETSAGLMLPDDYVTKVGEAARAVGAIFVLDCIASGCMWVNMKALNVDVLISAPQKGWSSTPCAGLVMLGERGKARVEETSSNSFVVDLKKWLQIMQAYEKGGHAYHATMPTDGLKEFWGVIQETKEYGFEKVRAEQQELGTKVRALMAENGYQSVAAPGFEAPSVVVCFTGDADVQNGKKFAALGLQIAAGVPLQCDEGPDFKSFRLGLFGLDKLHNVDRTVATLADALKEISTPTPSA